MTLNKTVLVTPMRNQVRAPVPAPTPARPNPLQTIADTAIRENPVASVFRLVEDAFDRAKDVNVPGFDAFEGNEGTIFEKNPELLRGVLSPTEKERVRIKAEAEVARLERIVASGPLGIMSSIAFGLLDPLILIPVGGQIRLARTAIELSKLSRTAKAAEIGKIALTGGVPADAVGPLTGAVTTARAGLIGASASELILQADQDMRTYGESALNVASSVVLSGLLGGIVSAVSAKTRRIALRQLEHDLDELGFVRGGTSEADGSTVGGVGSRESITLTPADLVEPTAGGPNGAEIKLQNALGAENMMARDGLKHAIAPFVRILVRSKSLNAKKTIMKLVDSPGVRTEGFNPGSSTEAEILGRVQSGMFRALSERSRLYTAYRTRLVKERGGTSATIKEGGRFRSGIMKAADVVTQRRKVTGDLSEAEFEELAGSSYRFEDSGIPEVDEYARVWGEMFDEILDDGISLDVWPEIVREMGPKGARNFLSRVYKQDALLVDEDIFKSQKIRPWLLGAMDDAEIDAILKSSMAERAGQELGGVDGLSADDAQSLLRSFAKSDKAGRAKLRTFIQERELLTPAKANTLRLRIAEILKEEGLSPKLSPKKAGPGTPDPGDEGIAPMVRRSFTPAQQKVLDEAIDGHVSTIFENLTTSTRGRINYGKVAGATGSPFKERRLTWSDESVKDYLEQNITVLGERYLQTVVPDLAIIRRFGSLDLEDVIGVDGSIAKDYIAVRAEAKTPKEIIAVQNQQKEDRQLISDVLKIFRGTYNNPPDNTLVSIGRALKAGNYTIFGGGFGLNSFPDIGMPAMRNGFLRAFKTGYKPFITHLESAKLSKKEAQTFGAAIEWEMDARSNQLWGVGDYVARNRVEKVAKAVSSKMSMLNLMTPWNSTMKGISANISMTRSIEAILAEPKGTAGMGKRALKKFNEEIDTLEFYRLPAPMRVRIRKMLEEPGGMFADGDLKWSNTQAWSDRKAADEFGRSIRAAVDNTILTPGVGGVPTWLKKEEASIIFQFQTFGFGATNTILLSSAQALARRDVDSMVGLAMMIAAGTVVEWTKNQINDRPNPPTLSKWVMAGIDRSGALGAYGQGINILAKISGNEAMSSRFAARNILSSMLGPSLGTAETLFHVGTAAARGEMSDSDLRQARRLLPYNQVPYWQWMFDQMEETTVDTFNLPRKRRRKRRRTQ